MGDHDLEAGHGDAAAGAALATSASPLQELFELAVRGEISPEQAQARAREPEVAEQLDAHEVGALSSLAVDSAHRGGWRAAVLLMRLLRVALEAAPESDETEAMRRVATLDWIEVVHAALMAVPDGRLYRDALAGGQELEESAERAHDLETLGEVRHRLGTMHLDPYTAGRRSTNYQVEIEEWRRRLHDEAGDELLDVPESDWQMPEPVDALRLAEDWLRRAQGVRESVKKGLTLKALTQALEWLHVLDEHVDGDEIARFCREALDLIGPDEEPQARVDLIGRLRRWGGELETEAIEALLAPSWDEYARRLGPPLAVWLVADIVGALRRDEPAWALEVRRSASALVSQYGDERARINHWLDEINLLIAASVPPLPEEPLEEAAAAMREQAEREGWDARAVGAALIALAANSSRTDEERAGLALLAEAVEVAPILAQELRDALAFQRAVLLRNEGVNCFNAGRYAAGVEAYAQELAAYLDLGLLGAATEALRRIDDLASRPDPDLALQVATRFAPLALRVETALGDPGLRVVRHLCESAVANLAAGPMNPNVLLFLLQLAKGQRFATALYAGTKYRWEEDEQGADLLSAIREAEASVPLELESGEEVLDEEMLLTAYAGSRDGRAGKTPRERLANLEHAFDAHLTARLLAGSAGAEALWLGVDDVQSALDERTVLVDLYLGATSDGRIAVYTLALTHENVFLAPAVHEFPRSRISLGDEERRIEVHPLAMTMQSLRRNIQAEPGPRPVDRDAADELERDLRGFLGNFVEQLAELAKVGYDHLCFVPHEHLHAYPLHLLGETGRPLADEWIVTYLPNLHLLASRGAPAVRRHRRDELTAFGLQVAGRRHGLPDLPEAVSEAKTVAATFGLENVPERQATEERLRQALVESRLVHLATHGRHNVDAPAFQCVYLTPSDETDGRLYAHELLSLDLRGLELITLSACETALGRFDAGDNLRGLPASLLLAGVSTLIGTLWPVETRCSEHFFSTLYRELREGGDRLDAFGKAQRETREAFPQYRDWGAFYFMGDWT